MTPFFTADGISAAFATRYHFAWYTRGRQPKLDSPEVQSALRSAFDDLAKRDGHHVLEWEIEPTAVRALLSLTPWQSPADVTRSIKGNLAATARKQRRLASLWSRGWFVRSSGSVTNDVIREYVAAQCERHDAAPIAAGAGYRDPSDAGSLQRSNHGVLPITRTCLWALRPAKARVKSRWVY